MAKNNPLKLIFVFNCLEFHCKIYVLSTSAFHYQAADNGKVTDFLARHRSNFVSAQKRLQCKTIII